jgi:hypothetical protein
VGALVVGPMADDPTFSAIEMVRGYVDDATRELAELWRAEPRKPQPEVNLSREGRQ